MKDEKIVETPLMKQYFSVKAQYPEAVLLFRVGDFYETFADDALITSKVLGIVLTKRANGSASSVPLAGFPHHSIDLYLPRLVRAGYKVVALETEKPTSIRRTVSFSEAVYDGRCRVEDVEGMLVKSEAEAFDEIRKVLTV